MSNNSIRGSQNMKEKYNLLVHEINALVETTAADIAELDVQIESNTTEIEDNSLNIISNTADIAELDVQIESNTTEIENDSLNIISNTADIAELDVQIESKATEIEDNSLNIISNTADIAELDVQIESKATEIEDNSLNIISNTADIAELDVQIESKATEIEDNSLNIISNTADIAEINEVLKVTDGNSGNPNTDNVAVGYSTLNNKTTATGNVAVGNQALTANETGIGNTAVGRDTLAANTDGCNNIAIGSGALASNTAHDNIAVGSGALTSNQTATGNIAVGTRAMPVNQIGSNNIAIGNDTLYASQSGTGNTAIGHKALFNHNSSTSTSYIPSGSLNSDTKYIIVDPGSGNNSNFINIAQDNKNAEGTTTFGVGTVFYTKTINPPTTISLSSFNDTIILETDGYHNMAIGNHSMYNIIGTTTANNTAIGHLSFINLKNDAIDNVAVGVAAGHTLEEGQGNIYIGKNAYASHSIVSPTSGSGDPEINLGYNQIAGGHGTIRIGADGAYIQTYYNAGTGNTGTWTHSSDKRLKKNIETLDENIGLTLINKLRPVTFNMRLPHELPEDFPGYKPKSSTNNGDTPRCYGFIAQEVKSAIDEAGHPDFPIWSKDENNIQRLGETQLIVSLVKAVQEQAAMIDSQVAKIDSQSKRIDALEERLIKLENK
jgi:trimeric autotransporter adhesin